MTPTILPFDGAQWLTMHVAALFSLERDEWHVDRGIDATILGTKRLENGTYTARIHWLHDNDIRTECNKENAQFIALSVMIDERGDESTRSELEKSWAARVDRIFKGQEPPREHNPLPK